MTYQNKKFQGGELTCLTPEMIQQLQEVDNKVPRDIKAWIDKILEEYMITEFSVDIASNITMMWGGISSKDQEVGFYYRCNFQLGCSSLKKAY